eukprot:Blabericola_migrator_1__11959@NODE_731_length_6696_cov_64_725298_g527_i0_p5_GENE_NODE_731_length_6696_cov_64_725298_g527_i0NODE_731_length_6696_cov_64_725298_g527_i0_p5_ORF_typecomplete_len189_score20_57CBM_20/PF00686_19/2_1e24FLYWCH_u/PF16662_5/5_7FLYWCH_u/PF16662_5/6e02FLYWCH_u/PF16662_5/91_NODE_731_length_6696_cov_64_725298_g527_i07671333
MMTAMQTRTRGPEGPGGAVLSAPVAQHRGHSWTDEDRQRERLRIRAKYAQRTMERRVEVYFKALEMVRQRELAQSMAGESPDGKKTVSFLVNFATYFGQELFIIGNTPELGEWNPDRAVKMIWSDGNNWRCDITLAGKRDPKVHYKYLVKDDKGNINWEWGLNHELDLNIVKGRRHLCSDKWGGGQQA